MIFCQLNQILIIDTDSNLIFFLN